MKAILLYSDLLPLSTPFDIFIIAHILTTFCSEIIGIVYLKHNKKSLSGQIAGSAVFQAIGAKLCAAQALMS